MLRPPEVHMFYRKIEFCIIRMGDNNMHAVCTHEQEMVDHVIPELQDKLSSCLLQLRYHWTERLSSSLLIPRSSAATVD